MNVPGTGINWLADATASDLLRRFPLPIALLDAAGGAMLLNDRFAADYGRAALDSAPLQALVSKDAPGWHVLRVPSRENGEIAIRAQVLRVQDNPLLILDDVADPGLLRQLDRLQEQIAELERLSSTDRLTGAWNRAHFDRVVATELDRSIRLRQPLSLILLDIDHFKRVNDRFGHQTGDAVLRELVRVIGAEVRSVDTLFRWGGEEFAVLISSAGHRLGATLAQKLRRSVELHDFAGAGNVTISLGVAEHSSAESMELWFGRADAALYRAKHGGRNRVCVDARGSSDLWAQETGASVIRMQWQEAYECGEPSIDREHRELFELSNALLGAAFNSGSSTESFSIAMDKLLAHVAEHFANEEALLAQHAYAHLEAHQRAHAGLLARARELKFSCAAGKAGPGDLVEFLANTVVAQHLFKADREFFPLFKSS